MAAVSRDRCLSASVCTTFVPPFGERGSIAGLVTTPTTAMDPWLSDRVAVMATASVWVEEGIPGLSPASRRSGLVRVKDGFCGCHRLRLLLFKECSSYLRRDAGEIPFLLQADQYSLQEGDEETEDFTNDGQHQDVLQRTGGVMQGTLGWC